MRWFGVTLYAKKIMRDSRLISPRQLISPATAGCLRRPNGLSREFLKKLRSTVFTDHGSYRHSYVCVPHASFVAFSLS